MPATWPAVESDPVAESDLAAHEALTTGAHGGVVAATDGRLSDPRAPTDASIASINRAGTLAARPAANTVPAGTTYFATDEGLLYRSNGSGWGTVAPGQEIGYAEITASSTSPTDGTRGDGTNPLVLSGVVIGARPVVVQLDADTLRESADQGVANVWVMRSPAGAFTWTDIGSRQTAAARASGPTTPYRQIRQNPAAGVYDFKVQLQAGIAGQSCTLIAGNGAPNNAPAYLRVVEG